jgi:hypothetical protein
VIQQKFWTYYKIPLYAGLLILLGLQLVALAQVVASRIENNGQTGLQIVRFLRFCALGAAMPLLACG